jgi:DNA-binding MarR family transcriptional regulator
MGIASIREFSRRFTQHIGALDESFLGRDRPLGESRLLYEIGGQGTTVGELRSRLGLDSGYTSRLLRSLTNDGLVTTRPDPDDRRRRIVELTDEGEREWEVLDRLSDEQVGTMLELLGDRRAAELSELLTRAGRLIASAKVTFDAIDPRSPPARLAMSAYFAELDDRFVGGFDPGDALSAESESFDPPAGTLVVGRSDDIVVGCGGLLTFEPGIGEIKRMWVDPAWRGLGLARRLLADLECRSSGMDHRFVRLDTNAVLVEAIAMYESAGYVPISRYCANPYAHRWFEKSLS